MNCSACGQQIPAGSKFCPSCGRALVAHVVARKKTSLPVIMLTALFAFMLVVCIASIGRDAKHGSTQVASVVAHPKPPYLTGTNLAGVPPPNVYTPTQLNVVAALYHGKMDGPTRFQQHCGKANDSYIAHGGFWNGATILLYSSDQAHNNSSGKRDDLEVMIARRSQIPSWLDDIYGLGEENSHYAIKAYLDMPNSHTNDENGYMLGRTDLYIGRAVVLLGCHA